MAQREGYRTSKPIVNPDAGCVCGQGNSGKWCPAHDGPRPMAQREGTMKCEAEDQGGWRCCPNEAVYQTRLIHTDGHVRKGPRNYYCAEHRVNRHVWKPDEELEPLSALDALPAATTPVRESHTMNRAAFESLIADDVSWLVQQTPSLERQHIAQLLKDAPRLYYPAPAPAVPAPAEAKRKQVMAIGHGGIMSAVIAATANPSKPADALSPNLSALVGRLETWREKLAESDHASDQFALNVIVEVLPFLAAAPSGGARLTDRENLERGLHAWAQLYQPERGLAELFDMIGAPMTPTPQPKGKEQP